MKALVVSGPDTGLELRTIPVPEPKHGEVLIRVSASPINPSDLLMISGDYGQSRAYPFVPGLEGSGTVVATGGGFLGRSILGKTVACAPEKDGLWSDYAVVPANRCLPLPKGMPEDVGAMSFVNPLAAIGLVQAAKDGGHRAVISTAAGGALGRMIRQRASKEGFTVINVVRREDQAAELRSMGVEHVLSSASDAFDHDLRMLSADLGSSMAFDAVAGDMTGRLAEALLPNGEILVYGELSGQRSNFDPATMTFKNLTIRGFWLTQWSKQTSFLKQLLLTRQIMQALENGFAQTRIARKVPLQNAVEAPALYADDMSAGKVLIVPN
ncbi:zinc-binding dehydrogenase [Cognatiyoonia sp. IB215446]|uniref:alcohol dehydrogenase catalytic domain-containing protein n=1 Tax=Cognatiyoonia sp. IB215446 TaxID=3097355 RepID=UPI002A169C11|nr:zinc-binding dehydrogenase [Cognatiyoonia sp. IB215446]MDX8350651.1 zinc-binding dehydrogenase [Cognatiyoonia sp. IB215446]